MSEVMCVYCDRIYPDERSYRAHAQACVSGFNNHVGAIGVSRPAANIKTDSGKPEMEELPLAALMIVARVMGMGARKYSSMNWSEPSTATVPRYCAAAMRHIARLQSGEILDPESNLPHLAHAAASLLIALHHQAGLKAGWK